MSDEDFDTTNASSVHLQDLSKLVSAFNEKRNTAFQVKNDGQDSGFHASDGVTTVRTTLKVDSNSEDRGLTMSTLRRDRAARLNWIQHVPSKESSKVIFKEGFNGISTECREVRSLADSVPSTGTDSAATEGTRNSLYLINELCDRLVTNDPQNNKKYADNPTTTETTFLALETPFNCTSQLSYPGARENVLSAPNATSNHYGFYTNSQQLSAEQISPLKNTTYFEPEQSNNSVTAPKERHGIECAINVNENTEEDSLDQRDQPLNTSEPIGAISHMQQMLERLTSPVELRGVAEKQGSGSTSELSRGNVFQCTSLSSFEDRLNLHIGIGLLYLSPGGGHFLVIG